EQGKTLVDQPIGRAEPPDATVPASDRIAPVLNEVEPDTCPLTQILELLQGDIADAEQACPAAVMDGFHRLPSLPVGCSQTDSLRGAVEHVAIDYLHAQVLERAGKRSLDLGVDRCQGIVRQAVILTRPVGKLCLEEQILPC